MTKLSVNINKFATLRNARGGNNPDILQVAKDCERFGAQGITVHPRPDERHIRRNDVLLLKDQLTTEFNIEGFPSEDFMELVLKVRPAQVTLVPDAPHQITSNSGWNTKEQASFLQPIIQQLQAANIRTSVFIAPDLEMADYALRCGADRVELYTEPYASGYREDKEGAIAPYVKCAHHCKEIGLDINAGHDLSLENLRYFSQQIPFLAEVSIGHALVCDALYLGLSQTIKAYLDCLRETR